MRFSSLVVGIATLVAVGACTDEKIIYETYPPFNPPPDSLSGFLGYYTVSDKLSTCGNCHVQHQGDWKATGHASAWANLVASGGRASDGSCDLCHTVNSYGNMAAAPAGYEAVPDSAYHDVQCESCHGPGFEHVQVPDIEANVPLARVAVDTGSNPQGSCAACHSGSHHPYWEEWKQSLHARMGRHADEEACWRCHVGQGALQHWGVTAVYEGSDQPITPSNALGITCAVCHDPHGAAKDPLTGQPNAGQLRFSISTTDPENNLCMKCHMRRTEPLAMDSTRAESPGGSNSPHAPQGAMMIGELGYQNPNYLDPVLIEVAKTATHGNPSSNRKLCAGCHLFPFPTTDTAGTFAQATGHLFRPTPCYGANGLPTNSIKNCAYTPAERSFRPCAASGCHASESQVAGVLSVARGRIQTLTTELWVNSNTANSGIDTLDQGIIPAVLKGTWSQRGTLNNLTLFVNGAVAAGDSVINFDATSLTGKLAKGNTLQIGSTRYTVTNDSVRAATNQLNGVRVTPPFATGVADNLKVFVVMMAPLLAGDRIVTAMDGAEFNVRSVGEDALGAFFGSTVDRSHTVHNPFLAEALLRANVEELTALYGSQPWFPSISPSAQRILAGPLGATGSVPFPRPAKQASQRVGLR
jgi:hypothetical protein